MTDWLVLVALRQICIDKWGKRLQKHLLSKICENITTIFEKQKARNKKLETKSYS